MPPFIRHLAGLFIGVPGAILWAGGWIAVAIQGAQLGAEGRIEANWLISGSIALVAALLGFAMIVAFDLLITGTRYRIATRHLAPCLGLELGVQGLFALSLSFVWGGIIKAFSQGSGWAFLLEVLFIISAVATTHLFNFLKVKRFKWELEALADERMMD
ncbi:hypothetical protein [Luteolibacter luteus]|uniref:Uncharacterized protein n=1 Tax=Luteolibacter luteus TaxID=2728835 RepID=A0A858RLD7_9BACT|nr:hypothetical protein [Luteolibacter luteus]QJE97545.1 hypothetical protein HHL09_17735 [Luteolibacter luteus]